MTHPSEEELQDLADDLVAAGRRQALAKHLAVCAECRRLLDSIEQLRAGARRLAVEVAPPEGEWEAIQDRIAGAARVPRIPSAAEGPRWTTGLRWAAGIVLAAGLSWGLLNLPFRPAPTASEVASSPSPSAESAAPELVATQAAARLDEAYAPSISELEQILAESRDRLDPETVRVVDENLAVIDDAIARVRAALESDPASAPALRSLDSLLNAQLRLLRLAAELPREI